MFSADVVHYSTAPLAATFSGCSALGITSCWQRACVGGCPRLQVLLVVQVPQLPLDGADAAVSAELLQQLLRDVVGRHALCAVKLEQRHLLQWQ